MPLLDPDDEREGGGSGPPGGLVEEDASAVSDPLYVWGAHLVVAEIRNRNVAGEDGFAPIGSMYVEMRAKDGDSWRSIQGVGGGPMANFDPSPWLGVDLNDEPAVFAIHPALQTVHLPGITFAYDWIRLRIYRAAGGAGAFDPWFAFQVYRRRIRMG